MKLTIGIIVLSIAGSAMGQMPAVIDNTRNKLNAVEQQKGADLNAVSPGVQRSSVKPTSGPTISGAAPTGTLKPVAQKAPAPGAITKLSIVVPAKPALKLATPRAAKVKAPSSKAGEAKAANSSSMVAVEDTKNPLDAKKEPKKINLTGRRDPFLSPVVSRSVGGSGCSNGKRCLAIDQIALKGVVKSETGMIALVTNALEKAYFLHENDPVFNGYVVRITGDSIVFKETLQDKLGKPLTREVTKKLITPVA
jgi:Tfp pilus assembly protein PilP